MTWTSLLGESLGHFGHLYWGKVCDILDISNGGEFVTLGTSPWERICDIMDVSIGE